MAQERLVSVEVVDHRGSEYSGGFELNIKFEKSSCHCRLDEGLEWAALYDNVVWDGSMGVKSDKEPLIHDILRDLVACCNQDGRTFHHDEVGVGKFLQRWEMKAFRDVLDKYDLTSKLPLDRALQVLQEYYVVEPIMES